MNTNFSLFVNRPTVFLQKSIFSPFITKFNLLIASVALAALAILSFCWIRKKRLAKQVIAQKINEGTIFFKEKEKPLLLQHLTSDGASHKKLNLASVPLSDLELASIVKTNPNLTHLSLHSSNLTDSGLESIKNLPNLQSLHLGGCTGITEKGLIKSCQGLTELILDGCKKIETLGLQAFPSLKSLTLGQSIYRSGPGSTICSYPIDSFHSFFMGQTSSLENLRLMCSIGDDDQLIDIAALFPQLRSLKTIACGFTDQGLAYLNDCKQLKKLELDYLVNVNGSGFGSLPSSLESLSLHFWQIDSVEGQALKSLKALSSLREFTLDFNLPSEINSFRIPSFSTDPQNLPQMNVDEANQKISWLPDLFENLAPSIQEVNIKGKYFFPSDLAAIHQITSPSFNLHITDCPHITRDDLKPFEKLPSIKSLSIKNCIQIQKDPEVCEIIKSG